MAYFEELPDQCPPAAAGSDALGTAYRILPAEQPVLAHFHSHKKRGLPKPQGVDDCRFASCSLFTAEANARAVAGLPKMRATSTHLAVVMVPADAGKHIIKQTNNHVDFWMYDTFDIIGAVTKVVAL